MKRSRPYRGTGPVVGWRIPAGWSEHQLQNLPNSVTCEVCGLTWKRPPRSYCAGVPSFRQWQDAPEWMSTAAQLRADGYKPDAKPCGMVIYPTNATLALFDARAAMPLGGIKAATRRAEAEASGVSACERAVRRRNAGIMRAVSNQNSLTT